MLTRGRALARAALLLLSSPPVVVPLAAQPVRTRNAGFSAVEYDNGLFASAITFDQLLLLTRERSSTLANAVVSVFDDGRWSMQGELSGSRFSQPVTVPELVIPFAPDYYIPFFRSLRGEASVTASTSAQQGLLPTMQLLGEARIHFLDPERGLWAGGGAARTFDGDLWRTTVVGNIGGWFRLATTVFTMSFRPQQLQYGDLLTDLEGTVDWTFRRVSIASTAGVRLGEVLRGTVGWVSVSATFPINRRLFATASVGSYPTDLLQGLPGAKFASLSLRLPTRTAFASARADTAAVRGTAPALARDAVMLSVANADSLRGQRIVRVRAPATERVEIMADFTAWEPVLLVRTPAGVWETTVAIPAGTHRVNVRLDGGDWLVPTNVPRVTDEFSGVVGLLVVR